jgi:hypothetical protein
MAAGTSQQLACKLRWPLQIFEKVTVTFRAGFPNSSGGVTYFGEKIYIVITPSKTSDHSSTLNDKILD